MNYRISKYYKNFSSWIYDICINCKNSKPVSDIITVSYPDNKKIIGPICTDCHPKK
jgi:hypothetical protein